ncbi:MAG: TetR family transcriptional regulator [Frankiales bacterium]|nr:TetR family transcriptional regulator [Frankiales bacterium]
MGRVKTYDEALRQRLLAEAAQLLSSEGVGALTLRRVAALADTSTTAVYSLFGDKDQLLTAMYVDGFARLGRALTRARAGAPLEALGSVGMAYRRAALAAPHLYGLMFGGLAPSADAKQVADAAFQPLVESVQTCLDSGDLRGRDAETIATYLWAVSHGLVSLEIAGLVGGSLRARTEGYRDALTMSIVGHLP